MFHDISWSSFLQYTAAFLAIYWFTVLLIYYRGEIFSFIKNGALRPVKISSNKDADNQDSLFDECAICATELRSLVRKEAINENDKDSILSEAKNLLRKHPQMFQAKWQIPLNNLIEYECRQHCGIEVDEKDLKSIWKK
jgi:uncharacterized protein YuzB (UPF0349 family)